MEASLWKEGWVRLGAGLAVGQVREDSRRKAARCEFQKIREPGLDGRLGMEAREPEGDQGLKLSFLACAAVDTSGGPKHWKWARFGHIKFMMNHLVATRL